MDHSGQVAKIPEETREFRFDNFHLLVSNHGLGFQDIQMTRYTDRENRSVRMGDQDLRIPFASYDEATGKTIPFRWISSDSFQASPASPASPSSSGIISRTLIGEADLRGARVVKKIQFEPHLYSFTVEITVSHYDKDFAGIRTFLPEFLQEYESSFIVPSYEHQDFLFVSDGSQEREIVQPEESFSGSYENVSFFFG